MTILDDVRALVAKLPKDAPVGVHKQTVQYWGERKSIAQNFMSEHAKNMEGVSLQKVSLEKKCDWTQPSRTMKDLGITIETLREKDGGELAFDGCGHDWPTIGSRSKAIKLAKPRRPMACSQARKRSDPCPSKPILPSALPPS